MGGQAEGGRKNNAAVVSKVQEKAAAGLIAGRHWNRRREKQPGWSHEILPVNGGEDEFRVDYLFIQRLVKEEGIGHEVVNHPGVALRVAVDSGKAGEIVVDGDALAEGLVDRLRKVLLRYLNLLPEDVVLDAMQDMNAVGPTEKVV